MGHIVSFLYNYMYQILSSYKELRIKSKELNPKFL